MVASGAIAILGIVVGYFIGYRSGKVAGELAALKEFRSSSRRRAHKSGDENG